MDLVRTWYGDVRAETSKDKVHKNKRRRLIFILNHLSYFSIVNYDDMNPAALILSVYILFMVSIPCMDGASCIFDSHSEQTDQHDHPDEQPLHGCSPFCICACCNVSVVLTTFHFESNPTSIPFEINVPLNQGMNSSFYPHIWQPPKISIEYKG